MRKLVIPQEAIKRHEETLGEALLGHLKRLANGWAPNVSKSKDCKDKTANALPLCCQSFSYSVPPCVTHYWRWVYKQFCDKHILTASPVVLLRFAKENLAELGRAGWFCGKGEELQGNITIIIESLFNYDALRAGKVLKKADQATKISWSQDQAEVKNWNGWSLAEFVRMLDVRYCPYCNAETVGVVYPEKLQTKESFSAIDHILIKKKYPLLALSLSNLVPACYRCNSQFKGEKDGFDLEHWGASEPFKALHPYAHNIYKWFRFDYRPTAVEHLFLKPRDKDSPLTVTRRIPLKKGGRKKSPAFYLERVGRHLEEYRLLNAYRDLYAVEINAILKMEMICTPTFVALMRWRYPYLAGEDFNLVFRRASLVPDEINHHRFGKLIIDLNRQIGDGGLFADLQNEKGKDVQVDLKAIDAAWEARKCVIEERVRKRFAL